MNASYLHLGTKMPAGSQKMPAGFKETCATMRTAKHMAPPPYLADALLYTMPERYDQRNC